jgi:hypothetical protein
VWFGRVSHSCFNGFSVCPKPLKRLKCLPTMNHRAEARC